MAHDEFESLVMKIGYFMHLHLKKTTKYSYREKKHTLHQTSVNTGKQYDSMCFVHILHSFQFLYDFLVICATPNESYINIYIYILQVCCAQRHKTCI